MRHRYECPLRWADLDLLGHVNNVTYVDYLQEARIDMMAQHPSFRAGEELGEGVVVARHELDFVAPLGFRRAPVSIESWVSEIRAASFTIDYEVFTDHRGRQVHLRASTKLVPYRFETELPRRIDPCERKVLEGYREAAISRRHMDLSRSGSPRHEYPLRVRWSDVDAYRHVNNVQYVEFFQEARIQYLMSLHDKTDGPWSRHVIARTDIGYRRPMLFRREPYVVGSWISRVGDRSFTISADVRDGAQLLAHSDVVVVAYDAESDGPTTFASSQRERLLAELASADDG